MKKNKLSSIEKQTFIWRTQLFRFVLIIVTILTIIILISQLSIVDGNTQDALIMAGVLIFELLVWISWQRFGYVFASTIWILGLGLVLAYSTWINGVESSAAYTQIFLLAMSASLSSIGTTLFLLLTFLGFDYYVLIKNLAISSSLSTMADIQPDFLNLAANIIVVTAIVLYSNKILYQLLSNVLTDERKFRALFEITPDPIFLIGLDNQLISVNNNAAELLGYQPEELAGLPIEKLFPRKELPEVKARLNEVKDQGFLPSEPREFVKKNGEAIILDTNLSLVTDAVGNPLHTQSVGRDVTKKIREQDRLRNTLADMTLKASTDSLTGLFNRRTIEGLASTELDRATKSGEAFCIMLLDMDELKNINDNYGHNIGDQALTKVANILKENKRSDDWAGRYGGDEFLIVFPGTDYATAAVIASRISDVISNEKVAAEGEEFALSASIGICCSNYFDGPELTLEKMIEIADQALYEEKNI